MSTWKCRVGRWYGSPKYRYNLAALGVKLVAEGGPAFIVAIGFHLFAVYLETVLPLTVPGLGAATGIGFLGFFSLLWGEFIPKIEPEC